MARITFKQRYTSYAYRVLADGKDILNEEGKDSSVFFDYIWGFYAATLYLAIGKNFLTTTIACEPGKEKEVLDALRPIIKISLKYYKQEAK